MLALRLDDVGASTKRYEVYSHHVLRLWKLNLWYGNWLFLKYLPPFKMWGPYREMKEREWLCLYELLENYQAKLTVAVTAAWVESETNLIPFPKKFPSEAAILKEGVEQGLIEIANHGLTHCVLKNNLFRPKLFSSNRKYHREFWDWISPEIHEKHIARSKKILEDFFKVNVITFVPPGNNFADFTIEIVKRYGFQYISCQTPKRMSKGIAIVGDEQVLPFHDREIVLHGVQWFREILEKNANSEFCFVRDLGQKMLETFK